jgi:hypothetical protein
MNKPALSVTGLKLNAWFSITDTGLVAVNGKRLNMLSLLTVQLATMVETGHGFCALDARGE